mgnify:FL=1
MPRRRPQKKEGRKTIGIEAIVEPGVGAIYTRGTWMKKLDDLGKRERKPVKKRKVKPK